MKTIHKDNGIFQLADAFVNQTGSNIFLTGKAGTGKTTFLQHIRETSFKNPVIVAPTGVAAINAGGVTIHSFFQLPIGTFIPENRLSSFDERSRAVFSHADLLRKIRINAQKRKLMRELELLIIDEISMVRADVLDAVDTVLKHIRHNHTQPFGGVQVLMIGDLYQLPPVVPEDEKQLLSSYYESPYFFASKVITTSPPVCLELDKIYRQSDETFIGMLNKIRHNQLSEDDLEWLNGFYKPDFKPGDAENYITLCSHHYKANAINERELEKLPGKAFHFEASRKGEFNENAAPADQTLVLKKGAQVMFIRNDKGESKRYFNGKIGIIEAIAADEIRVAFPGEQGSIKLEKEEWKNIRYSFDESSGGIMEKELGSFRQYPIRLAWAITIHKSQGLTFERAIIDAGDSFTSGQVYVAFSRLKSLDGLVLRTRIKPNSIMTDDEIISQNQFPGIDTLKDVLFAEQEKYIHTILFRSMNWDKLKEAFDDFSELYSERHVTYRDEAIQLAKNSLKKIEEFEAVAEKFRNQLSKILHAGEKGRALLKERMESASEYFVKRLKKEIDALIEANIRIQSKKRVVKKYLKSMNSLRVAVFIRIREIEQAKNLAAGLAEGKNISGMLAALAENRKNEHLPVTPMPVPLKTKKGDSRKMTFEMYKSGKTIEAIAAERSLTKGTIESHLLDFISEGKLDVHDFVSKKKYKVIDAALESNDFGSLTDVKHLLGDDFSYNEIRAVMNHRKAMKEIDRQTS